jgi:hypothetical protein
MWKSTFCGGLVLALAAGGPISLFRLGDYWREWKSKTLGSSTAASIDGEWLAPADSAAVLPSGGAAGAAGRLPIEGVPVRQLADVFRFDVSPAWVLQRWPRVSTDLTALDLHGYRVPLVTGTRRTDLAGALTYYFNPAQQVARITFRGKTGDPRALIRLLGEQYRFVRRPINDPGRLIYESLQSGGQSAGRMEINAAAVVRADRPFDRYRIELRMERPE